MSISEISVIVGIIISILTGAGGLILSIITAIKTKAERDEAVANKKKTDVDAASLLTTSTLSLLKPLKEKILELESKDYKREAEIALLRIESTKLKEENQFFRKENEKFRKVICILLIQLKENQIIPNWDELDCLELMKKEC